MKIFKRNWTPAEAEEWRKEELFACIFSSLAYMAILIGSAMSFLLMPVGFVILGAGVVCTVLMYYIIDPKLKTISEEFEKKQKEYIEDLEKITRWE